MILWILLSKINRVAGKAGLVSLGPGNLIEALGSQ
jgi:hypothetical protein